MQANSVMTKSCFRNIYDFETTRYDSKVDVNIKSGLKKKLNFYRNDNFWKKLFGQILIIV